MTIQDLRYFVEIAKEKNFSAAAKNLYVTEATISHQILKLEKQLGYPLFERSRRNVSITPAGAQLFPKACQVLEQYDEFETMTAKLAKPSEEPFSIGMVPVMNSIGLITKIHEYADQYHKKAMLQVASEAQLCSLLQEHAIDFAIVKICDADPEYFDPAIYSYIPLKTEYVHVLLGDKLAPQNSDTMSLAETADMPIILDKKGSYYYHLAETVHQKLNIPLKVYPLSTHDLATTMSLTENNQGICFASTSAAEYYKKLYHIQSRKLVPEIGQYISILYLKRNPISQEMKALVSFLQNALSTV